MTAIEVMAATVEGWRPIVHELADLDTTACNKRRRPGERWPVRRKPVDCPHCKRVMAEK